MRVAIELRQVDPSSPGQQRYLWRLALWLAESGHDVHVLLARGVSRTVAAPLTLHDLESLSPGEIRRRVEALDPDVLLLNPERSHPYRGLRPNVVRTGYGTDQYVQKLRAFGSPVERCARTLLRAMPWVRARRRVERNFYGQHGDSPRVIAQSDYIAREIVRSYPHMEGRVTVVHNGVDLTEFNPTARLSRRDAARERFGIPRDAPCVALIGHNFRLKGFSEVVRALDHVEGSDRPWLLVAGKGTGPVQIRWAQRVAARSGSSDRIRFAGAVGTSLDAHAAADVLAHPSRHDSFGFVVLEAMATGLPVVSSVWAGASELIDEGVTGWIVDPSDTPALARALARALGPDGPRVGAAAHQVAQSYSEITCFERIESILEEIAGS